MHEVHRRVLSRRFVPVTTQGGVVRMKVAEIGAGWEKAAPEYEDCKAIAKRTGHPLKTIMEDALLAYRQGLPEEEHGNCARPGVTVLYYVLLFILSVAVTLGGCALFTNAIEWLGKRRGISEGADRQCLCRDRHNTA